MMTFFIISVHLMDFTIVGIAHANLMIDDLVNLVLLSSDRWITSRYHQFALYKSKGVMLVKR